MADDLIAAAMVPVDGTGQRRLRRIRAHHVDEVVDVRVDQKTAAGGENHGRMQILAGFHDAGTFAYVKPLRAVPFSLNFSTPTAKGITYVSLPNV